MAYQPAGNLTTTSTINHLATVYYNRVAEDQLRTTNLSWKLVDDRMIPQRQGKTIQFFRYDNLGANTTATAEGQVGTSLALTSNNFSATVSQYSDFISFSDLLADTAIDPIVEAGADQLGFRAALSTDNINFAELDTAAGGGGDADLALVGEFFTASDAWNARSVMTGLNIRALRDSYFEGLIHPHVSYDLLRDPAVDGFMQLQMRPGSDQRNLLITPPDHSQSPIAIVGGVRFWETSNVTKITGTPNKWRVYIAGRGAMAAIDLAGRGPQRTLDHARDRFRVNIVRPGLSVADPEGKIRAFASYNFVYVAKLLDTTNERYRTIDAPSSIVA